jgi:exosortase A-associated hydrolase 2
MPNMDFSKVNQPDPTLTEEQGYFLRDGKHLFYALYLPEREAKSGLVLCSPFAEEKVRTLRIYVSFARAMARLGVAVLCFDYYGDGDSEGDFETTRFDERLTDIKAAVAFLKEKTSVTVCGLLGLRWGATLAALSADEISPDFLILWEPIVNCSKYFYDLLRTNLASQMLIEGKVKRTREELLKDFEAGETVSVEGYLLKGDFFFAARENGLENKKLAYGGKTCIVQIAKNISRIRPDLEKLRESFSEAELLSIPKEFEWEKTDIWRPAPPQLFESTIKFMEKNGLLGRNI